ncbi:hypothetical protein VTH06DRAFT_8255 [Thermothelomyces fergusii]
MSAASIKASARTAAEGKQQRWFPNLCIRPAKSSDLARMARMASEIFQHERDIDHFNRHRRARTGSEPGAEVDDAVAAAEAEWRLAEMRESHRHPGRHFIIATCSKQPDRYLRTRRVGRPREVLLGWAEWQDPRGRAADAPAPADGSSIRSGSDPTSDKNDGGGSAIDKLTPLLKDMTLRRRNQALLVLSNGLAVNFFDAVDSLRAAATKHPEEWESWYNQYLPNCLGRNGDLHGRHLVLRSLVVDTIHWDRGVGCRLLQWGIARATSRGWDIQTLASSANASTMDTFREAGFVELGRLDILRDTQIALGWSRSPCQISNKRMLQAEASDAPGSIGTIARRPLHKRPRYYANRERSQEEGSCEDAASYDCE